MDQAGLDLPFQGIQHTRNYVVENQVTNALEFVMAVMPFVLLLRKRDGVAEDVAE